MSNNEINLIIEEFNSYSQFSDIDIAKIVDFEIGYAYRIASFAIENKFLKINLLRGIMDTIRRIESSKNDWYKKRIEFYLLKPRFAVAVTKKVISPEIYDVIIAAMNLVDVNIDDNKKNFKNFKYFVYVFESIIAYYKFLLEAKDV